MKFGVRRCNQSEVRHAQSHLHPRAGAGLLGYGGWWGLGRLGLAVDTGVDTQCTCLSSSGVILLTLALDTSDSTDTRGVCLGEQRVTMARLSLFTNILCKKKSTTNKCCGRILCILLDR